LETKDGKVLLALAYNGLLKKESGHEPGTLQAAIKTLQDNTGAIEGSERDLAQQSSLNRMLSQPPLPQPPLPGQSDTARKDKISSTFNTLADGIAYEDLKGKNAFLRNAYDIALKAPKPAEEFEAQLRKDSKIQTETIRDLRQLAFGN
jgi:hypothetical protein